MAFSQDGGMSKVSAMVKDSKGSAMVSKSNGSTFVDDGNFGNDGHGSAKGVQNDHEYDSSSSPYVSSSYGEDDSDYGEKDDEEKKESLAMMMAEVIENISPLAKDDGSASFLLDKGTFSKTSFGVIGDKPSVQILKRPLNSSGILPSLNEINVKEARGVACLGEDGVDLGNSRVINDKLDDARGLIGLEDGNNFNFSNQISGNPILPNVKPKIDDKLPYQLTANGGNSDLPYTNLSGPKRDINLPLSDSSLLVNGAGDSFAHKCEGVNRRVHFGKSDLIGGCINANKRVAISRRVQFGKSDCNSNLIDSDLECYNGDLISNDKVSHVAILGTSMNGNNSLVSLKLADENGMCARQNNSDLLPSHVTLDRGSDAFNNSFVSLDGLGSNLNLPFMSDTCQANISHDLRNRSDVDKSEFFANVTMEFNGQDQAELNVVEPNLRADFNFPNSIMENKNASIIGKEYKSDVTNGRGVNGRFLYGKDILSPNVAEVNLESFKYEFPPLNGRITQAFNGLYRSHKEVLIRI